MTETTCPFCGKQEEELVLESDCHGEGTENETTCYCTKCDKKL